MSKYNLNDGYNNDFFKSNAIEQYTLGRFLIPRLKEMFNPNRVLDVGCAAGGQIEVWRKNNTESFGLEGSENAWNIASHYAKQYMKLFDLRNDVKEVFFNNIDMVQSYEVAEHIEEEFANNYVDVMCMHNPNNIIMTAAPPGQGGTHHVNCQPKEYWIEKIEKKGYKFNQQKVDEIVSWGISDEIPFPNWWPKNVMIFEK